MTDFEDDILRDAEDDARTIEYIKNCIPSELKDKFSDDELYYFLDVLGEYYANLIDSAPSSEEEMEIDVEEVAEHLVKQAKKDGMGDFDKEDVRWVVDAELDYGEIEEEDMTR